MAKQTVKNYTINTGAHTITLTDYVNIRLGRLMMIFDVTTNAILYNLVDPSVSGATVNGNVITLNTWPAIGATDELTIIYDTLPGDILYSGSPSVNSVIEEYQDIDRRSVVYTQTDRPDYFQAAGAITTGSVIMPLTDIGDCTWVAIGVHAGGSWTGAMVVQQSNDQTQLTNSQPLVDGSLSTGPISTITQDGLYLVRKTAKYMKVSYSSWTSGAAATLSLRYMTTPWPDFGADFFAASIATLAGTVSAGKVQTSEANSSAIKTDLDAILLNTTGVATAANQTTTNSSLSTIATNTARDGVINHLSLPTATGDNVAASPMADKFGRTIAVLNAPRDLVSRSTQLTLTSTTETPLISAQGSGIFADITALVVVNTSTQAVRVDFRDVAAGTVQFSLEVPPTDTRGMILSVPLKQTTANSAWTAQLSSAVTDVRITAQFVQNQ